MSEHISTSTETYVIADLPKYLRDALDFEGEGQIQVNVLDINAVSKLVNPDHQSAYLLLRRYHLTATIAGSNVLYPPLILQRAQVHEALWYPDLAVGDAYVVYILCESVLSEEWISDLEPRDLDGRKWLDGDRLGVLNVQIDALMVLYRSLLQLGAMRDAGEKYEELVRKMSEFDDFKFVNADVRAGGDDKVDNDGEAGGNADANVNGDGYATTWDVRATIQARLSNVPFKLYRGTDEPLSSDHDQLSTARFGVCRRELYPWNEHEPDRNSSDSIQELNTMLREVAPAIEAKVTVLPALDGKGTWHQLGLFASQDLLASTTILRERSILTAIRPLEDALCDACGADLETGLRTDMRQCPGTDCDLTFCSDECAERAVKSYHKPNLGSDNEDDVEQQGHNESLERVDDADDGEGTVDEEGQGDDEDEDNDSQDLDYPPAHAPFCGNTALQEIGRTSSTETPEWDLYFLLFTRTVQMSTTQSIHPLDLPSIKYLWGDFSPRPEPSSFRSSIPQTLPFSLYHHVALPLQFFETLMHSVPACRPYSGSWLRNFDFWIVQTLFAKFRGVANAQQSTFDGKPEIAAVHPLWCLANHSCAPNVTWTPTGVREFRVREASVWSDQRGGSGNVIKIRKGDEIWSHYTDIRLDVHERRQRLKEVLGGICQCPRCLAESGEV